MTTDGSVASVGRRRNDRATFGRWSVREARPANARLSPSHDDGPLRSTLVLCSSTVGSFILALVFIYSTKTSNCFYFILAGRVNFHRSFSFNQLKCVVFIYSDFVRGSNIILIHVYVYLYIHIFTLYI